MGDGASLPQWGASFVKAEKVRDRGYQLQCSNAEEEEVAAPGDLPKAVDQQQFENDSCSGSMGSKAGGIG
eukprot:2732109-Karenia_brevis.AAC.1